MNTSLSWIKMYVPDLDVTAQEYTDAMTLSGTKVENYERLDEHLDRIVIGQIEKIEKHPDADKLIVCQVNVGNETVQIVTGAPNVKEGDKVFAGGQITRGPLNPHDILRLNGVEGVYQYLLKEVQRVYKQQGVDINDKHIEVIVSQMLSKYKIDDAGDTNLLPGGLYGKYEIEEANAQAEESGGQPCTANRILLGITKASLATSSFLSAASFQETTRVLTDAAIKGKNDRLTGLKENIMIGKLIPAGTGMKRYKNIDIDYGVNAEIMENFEREQELAAMEAAEEAAAAEEPDNMGEPDISAAAEESVQVPETPQIIELD